MFLSRSSKLVDQVDVVQESEIQVAVVQVFVDHVDAGGVITVIHQPPPPLDHDEQLDQHQFVTTGVQVTSVTEKYER